MITSELEKRFGTNTPIFTDEILSCFSVFSRAYVFRLIREAENNGDLIAYSRGVYYIPRKSLLGVSTICSEMVAEKKYIKSENSIYGVYAGTALLNYFGITTQIPNTIELITNNETSRKRIVVIAERNYIIRKSRCEITSSNFAEYTLFQLFSDMDESSDLSDFTSAQVRSFVKNNNVTKEKLIDFSQYFPAMTVKKIFRSGLFNETF